LHRNCLLIHVVEVRIDRRIAVRGRRRRKHKQLMDDLKKKLGYCKLIRGRARSHPVENWLWKRLWTCRKAGDRMNDEWCTVCFEILKLKGRLLVAELDVIQPNSINLVQIK
jgi:hypothetical protein